MSKTTLLTLIFTLSTLSGLVVFAPIAPVLAQETDLSTSTANTNEMAESPEKGLINEWLIEGRLKTEVQTWMAKTQVRLQDAAGQALGSAQQAAKDEIAKQTEQAAKGTIEKAKAYAGRAVAFIKGNTYLLISRIILFFNNLLQ